MSHHITEFESFQHPLFGAVSARPYVLRGGDKVLRTVILQEKERIGLNNLSEGLPSNRSTNDLLLPLAQVIIKKTGLTAFLNFLTHQTALLS